MNIIGANQIYRFFHCMIPRRPVKIIAKYRNNPWGSP